MFVSEIQMIKDAESQKANKFVNIKVASFKISNPDSLGVKTFQKRSHLIF